MSFFPQKWQDRKKMILVRKKNYREKFLNLIFLYNWERKFVKGAWWWTHLNMLHVTITVLHCDLPGPIAEISASLLSGHFGHFTFLVCVLCAHTVNFRVLTSVSNMQRLFGNCWVDCESGCHHQIVNTCGKNEWMSKWGRGPCLWVSNHRVTISWMSVLQLNGVSLYIWLLYES